MPCQLLLVTPSSWGSPCLQGNNQHDHSLHSLPRTPSIHRNCRGQKHHFLHMPLLLQTVDLVRTAHFWKRPDNSEIMMHPLVWSTMIIFLSICRALFIESSTVRLYIYLVTFTPIWKCIMIVEQITRT